MQTYKAPFLGIDVSCNVNVPLNSRGHFKGRVGVGFGCYWFLFFNCLVKVSLVYHLACRDRQSNWTFNRCIIAIRVELSVIFKLDCHFILFRGTDRITQLLLKKQNMSKNIENVGKCRKYRKMSKMSKMSENVENFE